ncbi:MAG: response regulator transcription factor [Eubacteriales bacterium]
MRLLLVEDERDLSNAIKQVLEFNNYSVDTAYDGEEALLFAQSNDYDGVILDLMLPKVDGITVVRELRAQGNGVPVLILTAKAETDDKILGLDSGADDYLTKPFVIKELLARIRALTRRKGEMVGLTYRFGNMTLDPETFELCADGRVRLTNKEYRLMEYLIRNHNILLSTQRIMENVWEFDTEAELNVVWVFISSLRKKMRAIGANCVISVSRGVGYKLEERQ